ncbi:MAG: antitoxin MazE family protein [Candidatus Andeanibacterium colombiense]|uniref:Antitoxin MazE family protein n=1 Tax=Candidatus Andeanibacterium colombiense TaxID=3121345 RepID=A0AAJ6BPM0_9SPHN|nr:MAG: antitoxin MazE family protein [Sphingomonadaceae bacterium]
MPGLQSSRDKVRLHRERLRAQGLRPIQVWVPDVRGASFRAEARRQSALVAAGAFEKADQDFIDAISSFD